jgi:molybdenum cofactor biosynthesis protein B
MSPHGPHDGDGESSHDEHESDDESHSHDEHSHPHHEVDEISFGVVTVSSSRTLETDESGDAIVETIESGGYNVGRRELVGDKQDAITATVEAMIEMERIDAVVVTGGTGLSPTDVTVEAVKPLFDQSIPGFGELFRYLSYEDIGPRALLSRAFAGSRDGVPVFCLPGSKQAATFGTEQLVVPTIAHILGHTQGVN